MAIAQLVQDGIVEHVLTQNIDGLHGKSGVPNSRLTEMHGNIEHARCNTCGHVYRGEMPPPSTLVPERTLCTQPGCPAAGIPKQDRELSRRERGLGILVRHVVTHGEKLEPKQLAGARALCSTADFALVLGSSLRVRPFSVFALLAKQVGIINSGNTTGEHDARAIQDGVRIYDTCDVAMCALMKAIHGPLYEIPEFKEDATSKPHQIFARASALGHGNTSVRLLNVLK